MSTRIFVWQGRAHGGAERITLEVARYLARQGHRVTLGLHHRDEALTQSDPDLAQLVLPAPAWVPSSFASLYASLNWHWRYSKEFTVVYAHTLGWWKTKSNYLFIHDAADLDVYHAHPASVGHSLASQLWRWLYVALCLRPATRLFSASEDFTSYLKRHGISGEKIIPSGSFYDETIFQAAPRQSPQPPYRLLFIGNSEDPRKNFQLLHQTFYQQSDWRVEIFGSPEVKQDRNFSFRGYVNPVELVKALQAADLFVMPSLGEGFSIALLEALATGIPCLVNEAAVNPELANIHNLVTFKILGDMASREIMTIARHILTKYTYYAGADPEILKFSQATILAAEYQAMHPFFGATLIQSGTKTSA